MGDDKTYHDKGSPIARRKLLRRGAVGASSAALGVAAFSGTSVAGCTDDHECARTPGFWKNHTEMWEHGTDHLHFGTDRDTSDRHDYFSDYRGRRSVLDILEMPPKGDKSIIMARHFIAARLNVKAGTDSSCIQETIQAARVWFDAHPVGSDQKRWDGGESIKDELDAYNNGQRCACKGE